MEYFKKGTLLGIRQKDVHYYYLILSEPKYFGCRWAYAFHLTSKKLKPKSQILSGFGEGFHALINFAKREKNNKIVVISENIDTEPFQVKGNSKVRIDKPGGGIKWYIYPYLQILREQDSLKSSQVNLPVASGLSCGDASELIDKKWKTDQVIKVTGKGQFPI